MDSQNKAQQSESPDLELALRPFPGDKFECNGCTITVVSVDGKTVRTKYDTLNDRYNSLSEGCDSCIPLKDWGRIVRNTLRIGATVFTPAWAPNSD